MTTEELIRALVADTRLDAERGQCSGLTHI
jgi:hypothetical protein